MQMKMTTTKMRLDSGRFSKTFHNRVNAMLRESLRVGLRDIISNDRIPSYSGQAMGAIVQLGRILHVAVPMPKVADGAKNLIHLGRGIVDFNKGNHISTVSMSAVATVPSGRWAGYNYFSRNDMIGAPPSFKLKRKTPWKAFNHARNAGMKYLKTNMIRNIPNISEFTIVNTVEW